MLTTNNLNINIGTKQILFDVNLELESKKFYSILGPNGSGKSTLLKALSGDFEKANSQIVMGDICLSSLSNEVLSTLRAVMPQTVNLDFNFLAKEIVEIALINKVKKDKLDYYVDQSLDLFGVKQLKNREYLTLSGGEKQRVQLSRVIGQIITGNKNQEKYLFLDECTSSLDIFYQHQTLSVIKDIMDPHNICVIAVLHDINLSMQYSDNLILLNNGKITEKVPVDLLTSKMIYDLYKLKVELLKYSNNRRACVAV